MSGCLGAIATCGHVAPPPPTVLRAVEKHAPTSRIAAGAHATEFTRDERVGRVIDDWCHQRGERVAPRDEVARVDALGGQLEAPRPSAPPEDPIDLAYGLSARIAGHRAVLRKCAECIADPACIEECRCGTGRLLLGAAHDSQQAVLINHANGNKPVEQRAEVTERVATNAEFDVVGVHEVEPQAIANENERPAVGGEERKTGQGHLHERVPVDVTRGTLTRKEFEAAPPYVSGMTAYPAFPDVRRVVVGSTNPVKIAAVRSVLARCTADAFVHGVSFLSGVPDQPWGDEETQAGALARAQAALRSDDDADLAVGIEGGVVREGGGSVRTCAWAAVVDRQGVVGTGGSLAMPLPHAVVALLEAGVELGHAMDQVARTAGTKHGLGAVGLMTGGLITRQEAYEPLVTYALAPWLGRELWGRDSSER